MNNIQKTVEQIIAENPTANTFKLKDGNTLHVLIATGGSYIFITHIAEAYFVSCGEILHLYFERSLYFCNDEVDMLSFKQSLIELNKHQI